jgi:hypothetical protein
MSSPVRYSITLPSFAKTNHTHDMGIRDRLCIRCGSSRRATASGDETDRACRDALTRFVLKNIGDPKWHPERELKNSGQKTVKVAKTPKSRAKIRIGPDLPQAPRVLAFMHVAEEPAHAADRVAGYKVCSTQARRVPRKIHRTGSSDRASSRSSRPLSGATKAIRWNSKAVRVRALTLPVAQSSARPAPKRYRRCIASRDTVGGPVRLS